ncbi:MAG: TIR domain-containing protein [Coriobacteriales bacterium]|nr:TIR domain-containing protein [Coriobacteriales bacterium]
MMPKVYEGDQPYIFVSYAHADDAVALPLIDALMAEGYRVWYDAGVEETEDFPDYIADHVYGCASFIMLVSGSALGSVWCVQEAKYAFKLNKRILPIYLEDVELPRGLDLCIGTKQAMRWYEYESDEAFYKKLFKARRLEDCLTSEGRRRRGVQPRSGARQTTETRVRKEAVRIVRSAGVAKRDSLGAYSWTELKEISRAIAVAGSDAEWKAIAKEYRLVDKDGKLQGDTKTFKLADGADASVRILGFRHDELAGGGVAGISFEFAGVPKMRRMNAKWTNAGGWKDSDMRRWLNGDRGGFLALLPEDLRTNVVEVTKQTNNKGRVSEGDTGAVTDTPDKLWLLSMAEVYGKLSGQVEWPSWLLAVYDAEGTQYQFYEDKEVALSDYGSCQKRGADSWWWLRSPDAVGSYSFRFVLSDGDWDCWLADYDRGVSPGFCF